MPPPHRILAIALLAGVTMGLAVPEARAQQMLGKRERGVYLETDALIQDVPEVVASGIVQKAEWSPTGRYVLSTRTPLRVSEAIREAAAGRPQQGPPRMLLTLWDRQSRRSREISLGRAGLSVQTTMWLGSTDVAVVTAVAEAPAVAGQPPTMETWLLRVDPRTGTARPLTRLETGEQLVETSPGSTTVLFNMIEPKLRLLQADGRVVPVVVPGVRSLQVIGWANDRRSLMINGIAPRMDRKGVEVRPLLVDSTTGRISPMPTGQESYQPAEWKREYAYEHGRGVVKAGDKTEALRPLWLVSSQPSEASRLLVAPDADMFTPSPSGDAVLYLAEGSAWVTEFGRMPRAILVAMRQAAQRTTTLSNAKQAALTLIMYAADYDDVLPGASDDLVEKLLPYSKTEQIFQGMVYTYGGGKLSDIENPAMTVLGHIPGPGGRAVMYADGHVKWEAEGK